MKMSQESYKYILETFRKNRQSIVEYVPKLKESGNYKDFNTRLAADCMYAFLPTSWICSLYEEEQLNDTHIKTGLKKALRELKII